MNPTTDPRRVRPVRQSHTTCPHLLAADDAERTVLGTALAYPGAARTALGDLTPGDLRSPEHARILTVLLALDAAGDEPGPILAADRLNRSTGTDRVRVRSWPALLHTLITYATTPASCGTYRRLILDAAARRALLDAGRRLAATATDPRPLEGLPAAVRARLDDARRLTARAGTSAEPAPVSRAAA